MGKVILDLPLMWADHHVLKVRSVLDNLEGVEEVYASSAWQQVFIAYDENKVDVATIEKALAEAGYPVGEGKTPMLVQPAPLRRDPQWSVLGFRVTETNRADIEMSGEFRRY